MTHPQVKLRTYYNRQNKFITLFSAWQTMSFAEAIGDSIDYIMFSRYKDILVDSEIYLSTVEAWLLSHKNDFEKMYAAITAQYDPLSNYDLTEIEGTGYLEGEKISAAKNYGQNKISTTIPQTRNDKYSTTYDDATQGRLESYTVSQAQDAPALEGKPAQVSVSEQIPVNGKQGSELSEKYQGGVTVSAPESDITADRGEERQLTRKGNIGVTTSQQMLESEIALRIRYNFINIFCDMFVKEMTLGIYDIGRSEYESYFI